MQSTFSLARFTVRVLSYALSLIMCCIGLAQAGEGEAAIMRIESELIHQRFKQAIAIAEDYYKLNPENYESLAYTYLVAGEHRKALSVLDSGLGRLCLEQAEKAMLAPSIEDFEYSHCFVPWLLRVYIFFALEDWKSLTPAMERLERVSYPNPISHELVYYDYSLYKSGVRSWKLDSLIADLLTKQTESSAAKLIMGMRGTRQVLPLNPANPEEAGLLLTMLVLNSNKMNRVEVASKALETAYSSTDLKPALNGPSLHLSILRSMIQQSKN